MEELDRLRREADTLKDLSCELLLADESFKANPAGIAWASEQLALLKADA